MTSETGVAEVAVFGARQPNEFHHVRKYNQIPDRSDRARYTDGQNLISTYSLRHQYLPKQYRRNKTNQPSVSDWVVQVPLWPSGLGVGLWSERPGGILDILWHQLIFYYRPSRLVGEETLIKYRTL